MGHKHTRGYTPGHPLFAVSQARAVPGLGVGLRAPQRGYFRARGHDTTRSAHCAHGGTGATLADRPCPARHDAILPAASDLRSSTPTENVGCTRSCWLHTGVAPERALSGPAGQDLPSCRGTCAPQILRHHGHLQCHAQGAAEPRGSSAAGPAAAQQRQAAAERRRLLAVRFGQCKCPGGLVRDGVCGSDAMPEMWRLCIRRSDKSVAVARETAAASFGPLLCRNAVSKVPDQRVEAMSICCTLTR
mmetsp:Transcript_67118/g.111608  ORF Transcript_67118/g.111608 Transcript_67118/m.111608 type:complete len:246 (-) Transcript_67118:110-847(-)